MIMLSGVGVSYKIPEKNIKFHYYYADLIDRFDWAVSIEKKLKITESFPFADDEYITGSKINSAIIAGTVEELCKRDNIRIPEWVNDEKYFLDEPLYGGDFKGEKIRAILRAESPEGFKKRNIFFSENAIVRV